MFSPWYKLDPLKKFFFGSCNEEHYFVYLEKNIGSLPMTAIFS